MINRPRTSYSCCIINTRVKLHNAHEIRVPWGNNVHGYIVTSACACNILLSFVICNMRPFLFTIANAFNQSFSMHSVCNAPAPPRCDSGHQTQCTLTKVPILNEDSFNYTPVCVRGPHTPPFRPFSSPQRFTWSMFNARSCAHFDCLYRKLN